MPNLINQLKTLVKDIEGPGCCSPNGDCCPSGPQCCEVPFAQVCFTCPPEGPLPTCPCPVKPLQMPCLPGPGPSYQELAAMEAKDLEDRYASFYNNYNIDYHKQALTSPKGYPKPRCCVPPRACGVTVDGKSPCCDCIRPVCPPEFPARHGCPTGFKPCKMKLCPPLCCNPIGVWRAQIKPCPPGYKSKPPKHRTRDGCCV